MIRNFFIVLILFVLYEGFYLLPEKMIVIPGVFRISDIFFLILPVMALFSIKNLNTAVVRYREESLLILSICIIMLISPLMAQQYFDQPYMRGIILIRQNFFWLSFFMFALLIRDIEGVGKIINTITILVFIYVVILLMTKYFPNLGIIHFTEKYYNKSGGMTRFGDHRLFFPYGSVPVFVYCITLANWLYIRKEVSQAKKIFMLGLLLIIANTILSTYTRALVSSLVLVTVFALITSERRMLKYVAFAFCLIFLSCLFMGMAMSEDDIPIISDTKLAKMIIQTSTLKKETGRELQASMYITQLMRSPLTGVGNLATRKDTDMENGTMTTYKKYGFFNGSDLGYLKIAGESGLVGIAWVIWFYSYIYRSSRHILAKALHLGDVPVAEAVSRGTLYFLVYLMFSGVTLPHFATPNGIVIVSFALSLMAVTKGTLDKLTSANERPDGSVNIAV